MPTILRRSGVEPLCMLASRSLTSNALAAIGFFPIALLVIRVARIVVVQSWSWKHPSTVPSGRIRCATVYLARRETTGRNSLT
jgi:hypothetical protein